MTTQGGATDFALLMKTCETFGPYCLIGGLAVNCYAEPVYTLDADLVMIAAGLPKLTSCLLQQGFKIEEHPHLLDMLAPRSKLRIEFTTDERNQEFLGRAVKREVLGVRVKIATLEDCRARKALGVW